MLLAERLVADARGFQVVHVFGPKGRITQGYPDEMAYAIMLYKPCVQATSPDNRSRQ